MDYGWWGLLYSWVDDVEKAVLVEISKQHPIVKKYIEMDLNATYSIKRCYLTADGSVYEVNENWEIENPENVAGIGGKPIDSKDHYCWVVCWYVPVPDMAIDHTVYVYIESGTLVG